MNCASLRTRLGEAKEPCLVFGQLATVDGTWEEMIGILEKGPIPASLVVVIEGPANIRLYVRIIEGGAFDFLQVPFMKDDLFHLLRFANWEDRRWRFIPWTRTDSNY